VFLLRVAAAAAGFVLAGAYGLTIALARRDRSRVAVDYARLLAGLTQPALGLRLRVRGAEHLDSHRPCVFIANHQSNLDIPLFASLLPEQTVVVAKKEVLRIPFFGWLARKTGNLLIDRTDHEQAVAQLRSAAAEIRRRGVSVWIFPEGTRGRAPGTLLPFKKGAFHLALAAGVPLVPIVMEPLLPKLDIRRGHVRPGTLEVRVLEPISVDEYAEEDVEILMDRARSAMTEALGEMPGENRGPDPGGSESDRR
jgi:1-acyl-sn-glycerol-3-phosphate acyltransferase